MGAGASTANAPPEILSVPLKKLPEAVEESLYVFEKFPCVLDPTEQASRFFKYQSGAYINMEDPTQNTKKALNRALVASFLNGRAMTLKFASLKNIGADFFEEGTFPKEILDRSAFADEKVWQSVLKESLGDPTPDEATFSTEFVFIICVTDEFIPPEIASKMRIVKVIDASANAENAQGNQDSLSCGDAGMDQIASLFGANEVIRNSPQLVEAAFDGELDEMKSIIEKGYHIESFDGRKHTALSEAASQGHMHIVQFLLDSGADPNALSDTGRSPLWRAAFNGHAPVVKLLLESGGNPQYRDKVSMESAYDVASTEEVRQLLSEWDFSRTEKLIEKRRQVIMANLEARIKSSAEREQVARNLLRKELVEKAENGDIEGIRELLTIIADEAKQSNSKPRASVEVRNDLGQSLLSIAAQNDNEPLAEFLLTYWKTIDADRWDLSEGEISPEAKIFKANPNSRDLKGWTCICIAVFHDSRKVLRLLLEHGGDPNIRSSYNKNAWDLAKDELDAAEKVVKSHADIRNILEEYDKSSTRIFGNGEVVKSTNMYDGLDKDGSALVMNIELNAEAANEDKKAPKAKPKGKGGGGGGGGGGKGKGGGGKKK